MLFLATSRLVMVAIMVILVLDVEIVTPKDLVSAGETTQEKIDRLLQWIKELEESEVPEEMADMPVSRGKEKPVSLVDRKLSFPDPPSILNYVQLPGTAEDLQEFTICLHMRTDCEGGSALFTYYDKDGNEQISLYSDERRTLYKLRINGRHHGQEKANLKNLDGKWHVICVLWEGKNGWYEIWSDGRMRVSGEGLDTDFKISGGGTFVLGQSGDNLDDGFEDTAAFSGDISHFNVWDRWLPKAELKKKEDACKSEGNIVNWNAEDIKLTVQGKILIDKFTCVWKREIPAADVNEVDQLTELAKKDDALEDKE